MIVSAKSFLLLTPQDPIKFDLSDNFRNSKAFETALP